MVEHMTKAALLAKLRTEHDAFETVLAPLTVAQMTTPGVTGRWSIKDVLAHVTAWERCVLDRLQAALHGTAPTCIAHAVTDEETDRVNAQFCEEARPLSLRAVLAAFRATHQQMLDTIEALSDADLATPGRFPWLSEPTLWEAARIDPHNEEHRIAIQHWLQTQGEA
jgi:hypothetical protein